MELGRCVYWCCICYYSSMCFDSLRSNVFFLYLFKFLKAHDTHNVLVHAITSHVSCQHSPLHTRAKNHVPTPPRRQHVADENADFEEVSSPCPKVIHFPFEFPLAVVSSSKGILIQFCPTALIGKDPSNIRRCGCGCGCG